MQLPTCDVSIITNDIVAIVKSNSSKKNCLEQAINSIDEQHADEVISTCLEKLMKVDDSLQQVFINTIFAQPNNKIKKALVQVLMSDLDKLAA